MEQFTEPVEGQNDGQQQRQTARCRSRPGSPLDASYFPHFVV